ncbi:8173_t:CDS:10 [Paraglomus brasilianum]|uniref:8173_t:CDS:1 n=1 Tax=Paraglomus brasilianum TaxID=144538 RepID=A0A9N9G914_9GLOM|nr:8173_t:CDS:10 [Paraglomus brasilianum]
MGMRVPIQHSPILERDSHSRRARSRSHSTSSTQHSSSPLTIANSASAAVSTTYSNPAISAEASASYSSLLTSPLDTSSVLHNDEIQRHTRSVHRRDEFEELSNSNSDEELHRAKRPRIEGLNTETKINMRINQNENGVGGSANGISHVSNGDTKECANGQAVVNKNENPRKKELVRLIVQSLQDMGYSQSASLLESESSCKLESQAVAQFREGVLKGDWDLVESLLSTLELDQSKDAVVVKFLIREQKYLELLEIRQLWEALTVLREELTPLNHNIPRRHVLSSYMMCSSAEDLKRRADWDGAKGNSRQKLLLQLQKYISPSVMVPEHRLETLLDQALMLQRIQCLYHNSDDHITLYSDHNCDRSQFPTVTTHIFDQHKDEVWYVAFSNGGKYLASASRDKTAIVWSLENWELVHILEDHEDFVSFLSWSPDDSMLLTCGQDHLLKLWNTKTGKCVITMSEHSDAVTACAWLPDGKSFISGCQDKVTILWSLDGHILHKWTGTRLMDLAINKEGTRMVAICHSMKIHIYNLITKMEEEPIEETAHVTSVCLSDDCRYALVNLATSEIHLWDIEEKHLVRKYFGQKQGKYVIRSCFGGLGQGFVVSGSEDSNIYAWNRQHTTLLEVLSGHRGIVNSVNWNPVDPHMFASAGDDHTIRIWGISDSADKKEKTTTA